MGTQNEKKKEISMKTKQKILCAKIKNEIGEKTLKQNHRKWEEQKQMVNGGWV